MSVVNHQFTKTGNIDNTLDLVYSKKLIDNDILMEIYKICKKWPEAMPEFMIVICLYDIRM